LKNEILPFLDLLLVLEILLERIDFVPKRERLISKKRERRGKGKRRRKERKMRIN